MRVLECGCEQHQDTGQFMSLCFDHGQHVKMRLQADQHPRNSNRPRADWAREEEFLKLLAPVVFGRVPSGAALDPETCAEKLFQCVQSITRRME